ncbi:hypothetical protein QQS45_00075 [Alteriqipengyuania flavescens]|uniref:hypothetical protein n=1 Tax=Alteriqipengyuania flavescens TaxID=3053610 RepID=UPI0025B3F0E5|nr:hypothetical protein [Alteriqipengyuania flavescens]WJY18686.1 hypothetical protein QQW98_00075 [Alteriqipengyuania flavescens]WJY24626.1 hypothetical protein QQS45_00075 [Alteriqipengyuania flavescens]
MDQENTIMAFETIENCAPAKPAAVPADGVRFTARTLQRRDRKAPARFILLSIGAALAKRLALSGERTSLALAFGSGSDAGKMRLSVDVSSGSFPAKRDKKGNYNLTLNAATADGLFALEFEPASVPEVEVGAAMGKPPFAIVDLPEAMLALDD